VVVFLLAAMAAASAGAQTGDITSCRREALMESTRYEEAVKVRLSRGPLSPLEQQTLEQKSRRLREVQAQIYNARTYEECAAGLMQYVQERGPVLDVTAPVAPTTPTTVLAGNARDCLTTLSDEVNSYETVTRQFADTRLPVTDNRQALLDNVRRFRELAAAVSRGELTCPAALAQIRAERPALLAMVFVPPKPVVPAPMAVTDAVCRSEIDRQLRLMGDIVQRRGGQNLGDTNDLAQLQERYARMTQLKIAAGPGFQETSCTTVLAALARERGVMLGALDVFPPATPASITTCAATLRREIAPLEDAVARGLGARVVDHELQLRVDAALRDMRTTLYETTTQLVRYALAGNDAEVNTRCTNALTSMVRRHLPVVTDLNIALSQPRRPFDKPIVVSPDLQGCVDDLRREQQVLDGVVQQIAKVGGTPPADVTSAMDRLKAVQTQFADGRWTADTVGRCRINYSKTVIALVPTMVNISVGLASARTRIPVVDPQMLACQADIRGERAAYEGLRQRLRDRAPQADLSRFELKTQPRVIDPETLDLSGRRLPPDRCREQYYATVETLAPLMAELGTRLAQDYQAEIRRYAPLRR